MDRDDRRRVSAVADELQGWLDRARTVLAHRQAVDQAAAQADAALRAGLVDVRHRGAQAWRVVPLGDRSAVAALAAQASLAPATPDDLGRAQVLVDGLPTALHDVKAATGLRRLVAGSGTKEKAAQAAAYLEQMHAWAASTGLPALLDRLRTVVTPPVETALLAARFGTPGSVPEPLPAARLSVLTQAGATVDAALAGEPAAREAAAAAATTYRDHEARRVVAAMPVDALKEGTAESLRVTALTDAGITTVQGVLDRTVAQLDQLPGIGEVTAQRLRAAAETLWRTARDDVRVRIDPQDRAEPTTRLLHQLGVWDAVRRLPVATEVLETARDLRPLTRLPPGDAVVLAGELRAADLALAIDSLTQRAGLLTGAVNAAGSTDPWDDFTARPADYYALLAALGYLTGDVERTHGDLPEDVVEAVRALDLRTDHLTASLRGYQDFGARFAVVQRKVVIGDEMGLGKTVEALALLAHLRALGAEHFVVVCPAAVVTNWVREVAAKSTLPAHRLHGDGRDRAVQEWLEGGGVAVTTYETLPWMEQYDGIVPVACVVVDEAHYIKNPDAQRSRRCARLIAAAERAVLLTGTPLENRVEEFRTLVGYLRPDLLAGVGELAPARFRKQVAPAYLRRNQEDVLTELPELVEVDEWLALSPQDEATYREAVRAGNFMAMRQAAMRHGLESEKVRRLVEIVEEAEDNGRRVIVFSHFLDALDTVASVLPGAVFGPLTGAVPAAERQTIVDRFSAASGGAALVSQIVAGGVGLNIQAASVVVICEPQLKPTTEWQAIARAHRMGQLETVQVHRLLTDDAVDERITELLARKKALFDEYARESATADSAPEAVDVTDAELARQVVAAEQDRLGEGAGDEGAGAEGGGEAPGAESAAPPASPATGVEEPPLPGSQGVVEPQ